MLTYLKNYTEELLQILYPNLCVACENHLNNKNETICIQCQLSLPLTNYWSIRDNKMERHLQGRFPFEYAMALCFFSADSTIQTLLHELKYKGQTRVGEQLGNILGAKIAISNINKPDVIIPLPLHWKKKQKRGYNQSYHFAKGISEFLNIPIVTTAVERIRESETQTKKTRFERIENVEGIFKLIHPDLIKDKHILLVDDVMTTGATIEACATTILTVNSKISIATIAVAE